MLDKKESIILAALFVSKEPLRTADLYNILKKAGAKHTKKEIEEALKSINLKLVSFNFPWEIKELPNGTFDLFLREEYFAYVGELAPSRELSRATLQTLALIAYKSPIKQKEVIEIRGHRAHEQIKELVEKGFVSVEKIGNYNVLRITKKFLKYFGLRNEDELKQFFAQYGKAEDNQ